MFHVEHPGRPAKARLPPVLRLRFATLMMTGRGPLRSGRHQAALRLRRYAPTLRVTASRPATLRVTASRPATLRVTPGGLSTPALRAFVQGERPQCAGVEATPSNASNRTCVKIGLSYDKGTPKYRLYTGALMAAAETSNIDVQPFWLAGVERPFDETALLTVDALLITGGADIEPARYGRPEADEVCSTFPGRDEAEWKILTAAFARRLPILAICRGMQLVNVFRGGTLIPDLTTAAAHLLEDDARHPIEIEHGTSLALLAGTHEGEVTSSHHQGIATLGRGLRVAARHRDGTIEAIEWNSPMRKPWLAAVQWHPEQMGPDEPLAHALLRGFLQATAVSHV